MKKLKLTMIIIASLLMISVVSADEFCYIPFTLSIWKVPYSNNIPTLDGSIEYMEWSDALVKTVDIYGTPICRIKTTEDCFQYVPTGEDIICNKDFKCFHDVYNNRQCVDGKICWQCEEVFHGSGIKRLKINDPEFPQDFVTIYIKHDNQWVYYAFKFKDKTYQPYTRTDIWMKAKPQYGLSAYPISYADRFYMGWDNGQTYPLTFYTDRKWHTAGESGECGEVMTQFPNLQTNSLTAYSYVNNHWELEFRVPKPSHDVKMRIVYVNADGSTKSLSCDATDWEGCYDPKGDPHRFCEEFLPDCEWHAQYPPTHNWPTGWGAYRERWQPLEFSGTQPSGCEELGCPVDYVCELSSGLCIEEKFPVAEPIDCKKIPCPSGFYCDSSLGICRKSIEPEKVTCPKGYIFDESHEKFCRERTLFEKILNFWNRLLNFLKTIKF